ncbi:MAG: hypothetical protein AB7Y46_03000 [Armatimonadota bacterium]
MSRGGVVYLTDTQPTGGLSQALCDFISELGPAANQALRFYWEGLVDLLTMPVQRAAEPVLTQVRAAGAGEITVELDDVRRQYEVVRSALIAAAADRDLALPDVLTLKPPFVSQIMLSSEQAALDAVQAYDGSQPGIGACLAELAEAIEREQMAVQAAYDDASLVAGRASAERAQAVFRGFRDLLEATDANGAGPVATVLREWADGVRRDIHAETEQAWCLAALAASKVALETASFAECEVDLERRQVSARDQRSETGQIVVSADPDRGQIGYELVGYVGEACAEPEQRFLAALSSVVGAEISRANLRHWRTEPEAPIAPEEEAVRAVAREEEVEAELSDLEERRRLME